MLRLTRTQSGAVHPVTLECAAPGPFFLLSFFSRSHRRSRQAVLALLSEASQDFPAKKLDALRVNIVDKKLLQDGSVSLLCARIVAEVIRICAPNAPYTDDEAREVVFPLLLRHLEGLRKTSGSEFGQVCELLHSAAVCKCFVMLAYTDMSLLIKTVEQFFETVQSEHFESRVAETMLQIMLDVATELDEVPPELMHAIFIRLQAPGKTESPEAHQLAKHLLVRMARPLELPLSSYLALLLEEGAKRAAELQESEDINKNEVERARKELQSDVFDVLFEVFAVAPDLLLHALPILERDITSEITWWRKLVVETLCRMFAEPTSKMHHDNANTFAVLLERFKDKESAIRCVLVHMAGQMVLAHADLGKTDLVRLLSERSQDPDESVRLKVCQTLAHIAQRSPAKADQGMMTTLSKRCVDAKPRVAEAATRGLAQAYHDFEARESPVEQAGAFGWIPAELLKMWRTVPALIEQMLDEVIFGDVSSDVEPRAHRLIKLLHSVADDSEALAAMSELLRAKESAQKAFATLLRLAPRKKNLDAADQASFDDAVKVLSRSVPRASSNDDGLDKVQSVFSQMNISSVGKAGAVLVDPAASYKDIRKAEDHLNTSFKKLPKPLSAYAALIRRVSFALFTRDMVPELFASLEEYRSESDAESQRSLLDFLKVLSSVFPGLFGDSLAALTDYARKQEGQPLERLNALSILANCGNIVATIDAAAAKALKKPLVKAATTAEPKAAKQAMRAILSIYSGKEKADLVSDVVGHFVPLPSSGADDAALAIALAVFAVVVVHGRDLFKDALGVAQTVLDEVVDVPIMSEGSSKEVSERGAAVARAIRFVSLFAVHCGNAAERTEMAQSVVRVLSTLLLRGGDLGGKNVCSKADSAALRLAAGKGVIRMALERDLDHLIAPDLFERTAWLVASVTEKTEAKQALLAKLEKHAKLLPIRFICVPVLACHDAAVRAEGAHALARLVEYKRAWMAAALRKNDGNADRERLIRALGMAEYAVPHMVHLLGHWSGFEASNVTNTLRILKTFIDALLKKTDHFTYLTSYFGQISHHCDASEEEDRTAEMATICDLAVKYLDEQSKARSWQEHAQPTSCVVPRALFRAREAGEASRKSMLPQDFEMPAMRGGPRASVLRTPEPKKRRVSAAKENEADGEDENDEKSHEKQEVKVLGAAARNVSPMKKTPTKKKTTPAKKKTPASKKSKKRAKEEEEEEEDEEEPSVEEEESSSVEVAVEPSPAKKKQATPAKKQAVKPKPASLAKPSPAKRAAPAPSPKKAGKVAAEKKQPEKKQRPVAVDEPVITNRISRRK